MSSKHLVKELDFRAKLGSEGFALRSGKSLPELQLRYQTWGKLNADASNGILICHALTGSAHAAGYLSEDDKKPGWWDEMIGPSKAFDSNKYFIVCSNVPSSCYGSTGPQSINPDTGKAWGGHFPVITIADMVNAQKLLMLSLKIKQWFCVAGGSLGGMQALQWAVAHPDCLRNCLPIATSGRLSPQGIGFNWAGRESIRSDQNFNEGHYYDTENTPEHGLSVARMIAHLTYLSDESMHDKFGRRLQKKEKPGYNFDFDFEVESYLNYQGRSFVKRFDANSYLHISRSMDYYNLAEEAEGNGDLAKALSASKCRFAIISFSSDWLFPPYQSRELVQALQKNRREVTYCDIKSSYGHDAFLLEFETLGQIVSSFLRSSEGTQS